MERMERLSSGLYGCPICGMPTELPRGHCEACEPPHASERTPSSLTGRLLLSAAAVFFATVILGICYLAWRPR